MARGRAWRTKARKQEGQLRAKDAQIAQLHTQIARLERDYVGQLSALTERLGRLGLLRIRMERHPFAGHDIAVTVALPHEMQMMILSYGDRDGLGRMIGERIAEQCYRFQSRADSLPWELPGPWTPTTANAQGGTSCSTG